MECRDGGATYENPLTVTLGIERLDESSGVHASSTERKNLDLSVYVAVCFTIWMEHTIRGGAERGGQDLQACRTLYAAFSRHSTPKRAPAWTVFVQSTQ